MKKSLLKVLIITVTACVLRLSRAQDSSEIQITTGINAFGKKPIPVALEGLTGEAAQVLRFDLYVQGFSFVDAASAQYLIHGSGDGNVTGSLTDKLARQTVFSRAYSGASLRRQAHFFANDIVQAVQKIPGIGLGKIAYKSQGRGGAGEIFVSDFDGSSSVRITSDGAIVAKPAWVPHTMALYYTSYAREFPDIFYQSLSSGERRVIAGYPGLNTSAAVSPDGSRVAMILSKSGSPDVWVCNTDGSGLKRVTTGIEDSSPCWSSDGQSICYATKQNSRRRLAKVSAGGGSVENLNTSGVSNPTEPDCSPDGKWIAFTRQAGGEFDICVIPTDGSFAPVVIAAGENPSWSPNSRTLVYNHSVGGVQTLSVLDVFTKQHKDCQRAPGSNSQPAWAR
jgi:TolB protein